MGHRRVGPNAQKLLESWNRTPAFARLVAESARKKKPGKEIGRRHADARRGCRQLPLGLSDVRTAAQQLRWQPHRQIRRHGGKDTSHTKLRLQAGRLLSEQNTDPVAGGLQRALQLGDARLDTGQFP